MVKTHGTDWVNPHSVPFWYPSNAPHRCRCWYPKPHVFRSCPYGFCCRPGLLSEIASGGLIRDVRALIGYDCTHHREQGQSFMVASVGLDPECYVQAQVQGQGMHPYTKSIFQWQEKKLMQSFVESNPEDDRKGKKWVGTTVKAINNRMGTTKREIGKGNKLVAVTRHRHWRH